MEDTTQDRELLEKCLELFEIMEKRCHTASIVLYVRSPPGSTGSYSFPSSIMGGIIREPNFNPLGPHAKRGEGGKGWVVNASKPSLPSSPMNEMSSESSGPHVAGVTEGEMGFDYFGFDMTFAQAFEPRGGPTAMHTDYFASNQHLLAALTDDRSAMFLWN